MASYFTKFMKLGFKLAHVEDEAWVYKEEPHTERRQKILKKYPEIKKLMGYDPFIAYVVAIEVVIQIIMCYFVQNASWPKIFVFSYLISTCLNHSLGSAIHEIGHNMAFGHKHPLANRALGMLCNLPMVVPMSVTYQKYHNDHHKYLRHGTIEIGIPSLPESYLHHWALKCLWLLMHPIIHGIRPLCKNPIPITKLEVINLVTQMSFNVFILTVFGFRALVYLLLGTAFGFSFHPLVGHFISGHYLFQNGKHATYSYYGPLNGILFNVGYHVEHHDFPYIPYRRLPKVREIAKEFYEDLPYHTSWLRVIYDFIFDPTMGPHASGAVYVKGGDVSRKSYSAHTMDEKEK